MNAANYLIVCLLFGGTLHAQDFKKLIKEMRHDYEQCSALQIAMEVSVYDSAQKAPYYKQAIDIKRAGNNYWYSMGETEMLLNEQYLVMVDNNSRQISFSKRNAQAEAALHQDLKFDIDSILTQYETFQYLGEEEGAAHYRVMEKKGAIEEVHFYIVAASRTLKKMAYKYRGGQYVSIRFILFDKNVLFDADTFAESRYITRVSNKVVPSRFFKQYTISYQ